MHVAIMYYFFVKLLYFPESYNKGTKSCLLFSSLLAKTPDIFVRRANCI